MLKLSESGLDSYEIEKIKYICKLFNAQEVWIIANKLVDKQNKSVKIIPKEDK